MTESETRKTQLAVCPLCQAPVEAGCLYTSDLLGGLQWFPGEPGLKKNLASDSGRGERLGIHGIIAGSFLKGIRCRSCHKIVLEEG